MLEALIEALYVMIYWLLRLYRMCLLENVARYFCLRALKEYHPRLLLDRRPGVFASQLSPLDCDVCSLSYLCLP